MSHYSLGRKRAACELYRFLTDPASPYNFTKKDALDLASVASGGASRRAIFLWLKEDLSPAAVARKPENRSAVPLLNEDQEALLVGFALSCRSSLEPVSLETLKNFCEAHLPATPSLLTFSRIMTKHGFSSPKAMSRSSRMVTQEVVDNAISTIEEIRSYGFAPDQLLFMDETGLWSNVREPRTYHLRSWCENQCFLFHSKFASLPCMTLLFFPLPTSTFIDQVQCLLPHVQVQSSRTGIRRYLS